MNDIAFFDVDMSRPSASVEHDDPARTFGREQELEHTGEGVVAEISLEWARRLRFAALCPSATADRSHRLDEVFVTRRCRRARLGRIDAGQGWTSAVDEDHGRNVARLGVFLDAAGELRGTWRPRQGRQQYEIRPGALGDDARHGCGLRRQDAATETVFEKEAEHYGVLHFATHFWNDDRQPLYSRIALADGVLQTYEIFDAKLNAELAVLSACNTGLGKLRKGEGLIGISRAFLYAGVPSLVVSLWSVDDEATARIMGFFYRHLQAGSSKKQALRQAKLDYLDVSRGVKKDPFYWAPFILNGDWRPLALPKKRRTQRDWLVPVTGFLLLSVATGFMWKRHGSRSLPT